MFLCFDSIRNFSKVQILKFFRRQKVVQKLAEKLRYVDWNNGKRKESFAVFAKSFSRRIDRFDGKDVYCFDLIDIRKKIVGK